MKKFRLLKEPILRDKNIWLIVSIYIFIFLFTFLYKGCKDYTEGQEEKTLPQVFISPRAPTSPILNPVYIPDDVPLSLEGYPGARVEVQVEEEFPAELCKHDEICETGLLGRCSAGLKICLDNQRFDCVPIYEPIEELCDNGIDDNCNGLINDGCQIIPDPEPEPDPEVCDSIDNDLDGLTDEDLSLDCYTGPVGTENIGECFHGALICRGGNYNAECSGETLPANEICDGLDNNCNGETDEVGKTNVVLILDSSGSMADNVQRGVIHNAIYGVLDELENLGIKDNYEWTFMYAPPPNSISRERVFVPFVRQPQESVRNKFAAMTYMDFYGANEYTLDGVNQVSIPDSELSLQLAVNPETIILVITDEPLQSYYTGYDQVVTQILVAEIATRLEARKIAIAVYSPDYFNINFNRFLSIVGYCVDSTVIWENNDGLTVSKIVSFISSSCSRCSME